MENVQISPEQWEQVCNLLNRNPQEATAFINNVKENNQFAYELTVMYLKSTVCTYHSKFHALHVLQYIVLNKKWPSFLPEQQVGIISLIWEILLDELSQKDHRNIPLYYLKKLFHTLCLLWKRSWLDHTRDNGNFDRSHSENYMSIYHTHMTYFLQHEDRSQYKYGCLYIRMILEEFSNYRSNDIILPLEFHRFSHMSFEHQAIDKMLQLSYESFLNSFLIFSFDNIQSADRDHMQIILDAIAESSNTYLSALNWDFGAKLSESYIRVNNSHKEQDKSSLISSYPQLWLRILSDETFLSNVIQAHKKMSDISVFFASIDNIAIQTQHSECLTGISHILIALASISFGDFKNQTCDIIGAYLILCLDSLTQPGKIPLSLIYTFKCLFDILIFHLNSSNA